LSGGPGFAIIAAMNHYNIQIAVLCFLITLGLQGASPSIPPTMLQAARIVQVLLGVATIYFLATALLGHGAV
jgi:hypothetical protein